MQRLTPFLLLIFSPAWGMRQQMCRSSVTKVAFVRKFSMISRAWQVVILPQEMMFLRMFRMIFALAGQWAQIHLGLQSRGLPLLGVLWGQFLQLLHGRQVDGRRLVYRQCLLGVVAQYQLAVEPAIAYAPAGSGGDDGRHIPASLGQVSVGTRLPRRRHARILQGVGLVLEQPARPMLLWGARQDIRKRGCVL